MKYYSKLKMFKGNKDRVTFNPENLESYSYSWFKMSGVMNGWAVLNTSSYSPTTQGHYRQLRCLLGYDFEWNFEIEAPDGLQNLEAAALYHACCISKLQAKKIRAAGKKKVAYHENQLRIINIVQTEQGPSQYSFDDTMRLISLRQVQRSTERADYLYRTEEIA